MAKRTRRIPSDERRAQILRMATRLFAQQGFAGTTTRQIAERVGTTETILFRLFPSKQELYWAVIDEKCRERADRDDLAKQIAAATDERAFLTGLARDILERNRQDAQLMRLVLFSGLEEHALSKRVFQTYIATYFETLADYVRQRIRQGAYRSVDPLLAARGFLGMVFNYALVQELFAGRSTPADSSRVSALFAEIWLKGMQAT